MGKFFKGLLKTVAVLFIAFLALGFYIDYTSTPEEKAERKARVEARKQKESEEKSKTLKISEQILKVEEFKYDFELGSSNKYKVIKEDVFGRSIYVNINSKSKSLEDRAATARQAAFDLFEKHPTSDKITIMLLGEKKVDGDFPVLAIAVYGPKGGIKDGRGNDSTIDLVSYEIDSEGGSTSKSVNPYSDSGYQKDKEKHHAAMVDKQNGVIVKAEEERKAKAERQSKSNAERKESIEQRFSAWNGSHRRLVNLVKSTMHDPKSFEHVKTDAWDKKDHLIVNMQFRGKNVYGGVVLTHVKAKININDDKDIEIIESFLM